MIKATGTLSVPSTEYQYKNNEYYIFLKCYFVKAGKTENEGLIYTDVECTNQIGAIRFSDYSADDLNGGTGSNPFKQVIDRLENLIIEQLELENPDTLFEKVSPPPGMQQISFG